jgi:ubiquinone/menaquinone biosynthesis C-methylase UbiE
VSGVAAHLGIELQEYDARIRTFIPDYEAMLDAAAASVPANARTIVDLGTGTGALAQQCLRQARRASIVGIDADAGILQMAAKRLGSRARLVCGSFLRTVLPAADAVVASYALHHVRTRTAKRTLYERVRAALGRGGVFITVDCHPASSRALARRQRDAWRAHLRRTYSRGEADALLAAWAREDVYVPLADEMDLLQRSGLSAEVIWRKGSFAVISASARR